MISWKNIWRNKTRSLVVIAAITLGLFGGLFSSAMFKGMGDQRVHEALSKEISHIQIHNPLYLENPEIGFYINRAGEVLDFIRQQDGVAGVTSRTKLTVMIGSTSANSGVTVLGIDPDRERQVTELYKAVFDSSEVARELKIHDPEQIQAFLKDSVGAYFKGVSRNPILIGEKLAHKLKIKVRSKVVLTFQSVDGNLTGGAFRVCGIYRMNNSMFEEANVFVRADDLAKLTGLPVSKPHEIAIILNDFNETTPLVNLLKQHFPQLEISGWKELQPDIGMMNDFMNAMMTFMIVIILLALGFGIVNTMLMVVMERSKELGMLMAIGMSKIRVFSMIIFESVLLCLTGAAVGIGISVLVINYFNIHGIDLTKFAKEGFEAMGFSAVFYPALGFDFYLLVTLMVVITGILASTYPALKALKLNPAEALRTEV